MTTWQQRVKKREKQAAKTARTRENREREEQHQREWEQERERQRQAEHERRDPFIEWTGNPNFWADVALYEARAKVAQEIVARHLPGPHAAYFAQLAVMDEAMQMTIDPTVDVDWEGVSIEDEQKLEAKVEAIVAAHREEIFAATVEEETGTA